MGDKDKGTDKFYDKGLNTIDKEILENVIRETLEEEEKTNPFPFILYRGCKVRGMIREDHNITFCDDEECNSCNQFRDAFGVVSKDIIDGQD